MSVTPVENASRATHASRNAFLDAWLIPGIVLLLVVAGFFALRPSAVALVTQWENTDNTTYTHGFLIAGICLWLLVRRREQLSATPVNLNVPAAIALGVLSVVWLIAVRSGIQVLHELLLPVLLWLAVCAALGFRAALVSAFAIGYLVFAIPVWGLGNEVLQTLTVKAVDAALRTTGVTAYVTGNLVHLASGTFEIAGGCSGLHFFIVGLALAALYGEVNLDTLKVRLKVLALAASLSILTNWVRVYVIILAGDLTDMQHYLVRVDHYKFGWMVFAAMMVIFFLIVRKLPPPPERAAEISAPVAERSVLRLSSTAALALLALAIGPLWNGFAPVRAATLAEGSLLPPGSGNWVGPAAVKDREWQPVFVGADRVEQGQYLGSGRTVQMYSAVYARQAQERELISYQNSVIGDEAAEIVSVVRIEPKGPAIETVVEGERRQAVIWHFYRVGTARTTRAIAAQLRYGIASLTGASLSRVVALRAQCTSDCEAARAALKDFIATVDL